MRRRVTAEGVAMGIALLLVLTVTVFVFYVVVQRALEPAEKANPDAGKAGTTATVATSPGAGSTGGTGGSSAGQGSTGGGTTSSTLAALIIRPTSALASSTLDSTSTNSYRVTNLLDGDLASAWNEGVEGPGLGEWVQFEFSESVKLARIEIANGYQKDAARFEGNPRVKALRLEYSNGTTQLVDLLDTEAYQVITPTIQPVDWVRLTIVSVYAGEEWEDTALSEVRIYARSD